MGPYDRRLGSPQSSITWFYVDHAPGRLPAEGQRPDDVGCVAKALQTLQLVQDGGRAVAEIAAMPTCGLLQLARRYAGKRDAADMAGIWRDGITRVQKFVASLQVRLEPCGQAMRYATMCCVQLCMLCCWRAGCSSGGAAL